MDERINTILCAIDFSESSIHALRWAADMAMLLDAHLTIVYPYRLIRPETGGEAVRMKKVLEEEALRKFEPLKHDILTGITISYDFMPEVGFISDRVRDHAQKKALRFLVMGKMPGDGSREVLADVVAQMNVPVVIVP